MEQSQTWDPFWTYTEKAIFQKIEAMDEKPEDEDFWNWVDDNFDEWCKKQDEEKELMVEEERAIEEGWSALPFAPELQPLSSGIFLASSVEYSWPGYFPGPHSGEFVEEELRNDFLMVPKVVKISKDGLAWKLVDFMVEGPAYGLAVEKILLTGEGDSVVSRGLTSMRILDTGELLLTRKAVIPGLSHDGPDFRGASYTIYSPI